MSIGPEIFQAVKLALFFGHQMNQNTGIVHDYPATVRWSFATHWSQTDVLF